MRSGVAPASCTKVGYRSTFWATCETTSSRGYAGSGDDQRNADVGVERGLFAANEPVLAEVVAVVGAEDDVGVVGEVLGGQRRFRVGQQLVDRLHRLGTLAIDRVDIGDLLGTQRRALPEPGRRVRLLVLNEGSRGSVSPGKSLALRGAGVNGWCGANVATSTANGLAADP